MSRRGIVWAVAVLVAVVVAASFALSASALVAVAGWAGVRGPLAWAVPVLADGGALAFSLAALVRREQGRNARAEWASLVALALVSVAANVAHAAADVVAEPVRLGVGVAVVGMAPLVVLQATHTLAGLLASLATRDVEAEAAPVAIDTAALAVVAGSGDREPVEAVSEPQAAPESVADATPRAWADVPLWGDDDAERATPDAAPVAARDDIAAMRAMRNAGASLREVGAAFGVHASTVSRRLAAA